MRTRLRFAALLVFLQLLMMTGSLAIPSYQYNREEQQDKSHTVIVAPGALAAINLPASGYHLSKVQVAGASGGAGAYTLNYDGTAIAHFPVNKSGFEEYDVDWLVKGQQLTAAVQGVEGTTPNRVTLVFTLAGVKSAPPISYYRAIFFSSTQGGANTSPLALTAVNFDQGPAWPRGVTGTTSAGTSAEAFLPSDGGTQLAVELIPEAAVFMASITWGSKSKSVLSLSPLIQNQAAATLKIWFFY